MFVLNHRAKAFGVTLAVGVGTFGITAAAITVASAQATPSVSISTPTATPSASAPTAVPELAIGPVTAVTSSQDIQGIAFPADAYKASPADENQTLSAEYQAMKSCMARYGIVAEAPGSGWSVPAVNHDYDRLFGLIDLSDAQKYGYHTGETLLSDGEAAPQPAASTDTSETVPNYLAVAMGDPTVTEVNGVAVPDGGCVTEARSKLGDSSDPQTLYENAVNYGLTQSDADSRVIEAFGQWSACMRTAGFSYATPMDAINDPQWATTTPSSTEVKVAVADVQCKDATNLTGLRVAVAEAWQTEYIAEHSAQFAAVKSDLEQQVVKANALLQK